MTELVDTWIINRDPAHAGLHWKEEWGNGAAGRPRLVQTQCWCSRDLDSSVTVTTYVVILI